MREIKFKLWNKKLKQFFINPYSDEISLMPDGKVYWMGYDNTKDFALLQYTGLKDKNGTGIYEEHICKLWAEEPYSSEQINTDYDWELIGVVVFWGGCFWFRVDQELRIDIPLFDYLNSEMNVEVIGNRFEHPHLLKEGVQT